MTHLAIAHDVPTPDVLPRSALRRAQAKLAMRSPGAGVFLEDDEIRALWDDLVDLGRDMERKYVDGQTVECLPG